MKQFNILINSFRPIILIIILGFSLSLKGQTTSNGTSPQFLFPAFDTGIVRMNNGLNQSMRGSFINEKQFLKIFPDKESELKSFIKRNHIRFDRSEDVKTLIRYFNELYPPVNRIS
jgi:hypothetical protein